MSFLNLIVSVVNRFREFRREYGLSWKRGGKHLIDFMILRKEYRYGKLDEEMIKKDPFEQFRIWFSQVLKVDALAANIMAVSTATPLGKPSCRMMLLKAFDENGFVFYTNFQSRKGLELTQNPQAALVFWWERFERQVRIEGKIEKVSLEESDLYFNSRPRSSQIASWTSSQSRVIVNRQELERNFNRYQEEFQNKAVTRPAGWGGYRLHPTVMEFWQGRLNRLHDRIRYERLPHGNWKIERLSP